MCFVQAMKPITPIQVISNGQRAGWVEDLGLLRTCQQIYNEARLVFGAEMLPV